MILWTIQDMAAWERLQRTGVLRGDGRRVPAYYRYAYRWMSDQMRLRLSPHHARFPLWGWYHWQGIKHRPDLRASGHLAKGLPGVRIEVELPEHSVLLSDFNSWHCVLNHCCLSINEQEDESFVRELERTGAQTYSGQDDGSERGGLVSVFGPSSATTLATPPLPCPGR